MAGNPVSLTRVKVPQQKEAVDPLASVAATDDDTACNAEGIRPINDSEPEFTSIKPLASGDHRSCQIFMMHETRHEHTGNVDED